MYLKKDKATGDFFNFAYDPTTGEGAKWDASANTMTVYVRDNGKYDWNDADGVGSVSWLLWLIRLYDN